jgi:UDP-glucose 4-epimerase
MFKNNTLLITGGTGSFGNAVIKRFLDTGIKEIRIFSRDEKSRMIKKTKGKGQRAEGRGQTDGKVGMPCWMGDLPSGEKEPV